MILKKFDGNRVTEVPNDTVASIRAPFYSYDEFEFRGRTPGDIPLSFTRGDSSKPENIGNADKTFLSFSEGKGFKGTFYCADFQRGVYLPGGRYLVFPVSCENYDGNLLIDALTGNHETLPKDVHVYLTFNTDTYPHYHLGGGIRRE